MKKVLEMLSARYATEVACCEHQKSATFRILCMIILFWGFTVCMLTEGSHQLQAVIVASCQRPDGAGMLVLHHELL